MFDHAYVMGQAAAVYSCGDPAQIAAIAKATTRSTLIAAFSAKNYGFDVVRTVHRVYVALQDLLAVPSVETRRLLYGRIVQLPTTFVPGGNPGMQWVRQLYGVLQGSEEITSEMLDNLKQLRDREAPEKQKPPKVPEKKIVRRYLKVPVKPKPVIVTKVVREVIKKKRAPVTVAGVAKSLQGVAVSSAGMRTVTIIEGARDVHRACCEVVDVMKGGGDPEGAVNQMHKKVESLANLLGQAKNAQNQALLAELRRVDGEAGTILRSSEPVRDKAERFAALAGDVDKIAKDVVIGQMESLGVAHTVSSELRLMTSKVDVLQQELRAMQVDQAKLGDVGRLVWDELGTLLKLVKSIGKEAQAQTEFLIQSHIALANEHGLINAANMTADAAQMFLLVLREVASGSPDQRFKVLAACGLMRQGLANVIVNLQAKGGSGEISRRIESLAQQVYERLAKIVARAEAAGEAARPDAKRAERPTGARLNVARRNAGVEVDRRRRELEDAEEEIKRLNRLAAKRK